MKVGKWFSAPGAATRNQHGGSQVPGEEEEEEEGGSSVGKYLAKALAGPSRSVQFLRFLVCVHVFMRRLVGNFFLCVRGNDLGLNSHRPQSKVNTHIHT
jgi:hypothetical protein